MRFRHENQECRRMNSERDMKVHTDQKRIIIGVILTLMCLFLCAGGVMGCVSVLQNGHRLNSITPDSLRQTMDDILAWQYEEYGVSDAQELLDAIYAKRAENGTVQTYVTGLYGVMPDYNYTSYIMSLQQAVIEEGLGDMALQKSAVTLTAMGAEVPLTEGRLSETIGTQGFMSCLYGLLVMDGTEEQGTAGAWTREALIAEILSGQLSDGGFAVMGAEGDVDVTAMTLQVLAPHYQNALKNVQGPRAGVQNMPAGEDEDRLIDAVERALAFLSERQLETGDYESRGIPNAESTSQVILALCALGRDAWSDEAFIKNGVTLSDGLSRYRNVDGGFAHTVGTASNDMTSSQVFAALSALERREQQKSFLFDFIHDERSPISTGHEAGQQETAELEDAGPDGRTEASTRKADVFSGMNLRWALLLLILAVDCGYLAYLCFARKYHRRRLCGIVLVTLLAVSAVWQVRIQTKEDYRRKGQEYHGGNRITVSVEINCDTVAGSRDYLPADGVIMAETEISVSEGASAFDALKEAARIYEIPIEYEGTAAGDEFAYIEGISYLYEYDFGELSGWVFVVNGEAPDTGCGSYRVAEGDKIGWYYTTELGRDIITESHGTDGT